MHKMGNEEGLNMENGLELRQLIEALPVEQKEAYETVLRLATVDDLTGLYNRRYFDLRLHEEVERARRFTTNFALIMIDIDDFKHINDTYGHLLGDKVLQELSSLLQKELRTIDVVSRYGGEEFVAILPGAERSSAQLAADRLGKAAESYSFTQEKLHLTVSIGVAVFPKHGTQPDELIDKADKAMYCAKSQGKNRFCVAHNNENMKVNGSKTYSRLQAPEPERGERIIFDAISVTKEIARIHAEVTLRCREDSYIGKQTTTSKLLRSGVKAAAEATINALMQILPEQTIVSLVEIKRCAIGGSNALMSLVCVHHRGRDYTFAGVALLGNGDEMQAAALSVLEALNRFLTGST